MPLTAQQHQVEYLRETRSALAQMDSALQALQAEQSSIQRRAQHSASEIQSIRREIARLRGGDMPLDVDSDFD